MENLPDIIHPSWHKYLQPLFEDEKMKLIKYKILTSCNFYPASQDIFKVFSMPLEDIKVVILGQDPYPNGEAIGYAFAVNADTKTPASLRIIQKEILSTSKEEGLLGGETGKWKTLKHWVDQGIFLLNTALTVERGNANSHTNYWQWFTKEIIKIISKEVSPIWMLWGAKAQGFRDYIGPNKCAYPVSTIKSNITGEMEPTVDIAFVKSHNTNMLLQAPHPAAELYSGGKTTFSGCNHFNLCNEILELQGKEKINW